MMTRKMQFANVDRGTMSAKWHIVFFANKTIPFSFESFVRWHVYFICKRVLNAKYKNVVNRFWH